MRPHHRTFRRAIYAPTNFTTTMSPTVLKKDGIYPNKRDLQYVHESKWPIVICLLGRFRILKAGCPLILHGSKTEALLVSLALQHNYCVQRDALLSILWPDCDPLLASQSLNSLTHSLKKLLGDEIGGAMPVLNENGYYRLNVENGVGVDVSRFEELVALGDQHSQRSNSEAAAAAYSNAIDLYQGELCEGINITSSSSVDIIGTTGALAADLRIVVERERLQSIYLSVLARLADYYYAAGNYQACEGSAHRILAIDPCREDAHRTLMLCYSGRGERSQALRQYRLCEDMLRIEFDATPEPATIALFDLMRQDPGSINVGEIHNIAIHLC